MFEGIDNFKCIDINTNLKAIRGKKIFSKAHLKIKFDCILPDTIPEAVILKFCMLFLHMDKRNSNLYKPALHPQQYIFMYFLAYKGDLIYLVCTVNISIICIPPV